jgi:LysM repeat protein
VRGLNADGVTWTIQSGDTLSGIASKVIQDASRWREIVAANPDKPKHPDWGLWLNPGDVIKLPASWVGAPAEPVAPIPEPTIVPSTPGLPEAPAEVVEAVEEVLPGLVGTLPTILTGGQATSETVSADTILEIKSLLGYWGTAHVADGRNPHVDYPSLNEENQPEWTRRDQSMAQAFNQWWEDNSRQPEIAAEEDWDQPTAGLLARLKLWNVEWLASHAAAEAQEAVEEAVEQVTPEEPAMPAEVPPLPGAPTAEPVVGPGGEAPQQATPPEVVPPLPGAPTAGPAPEGEEAGAGAAVAALGAIGAAVAYGTGALKF